jgi:hypothetical protein
LLDEPQGGVYIGVFLKDFAMSQDAFSPMFSIDVSASPGSSGNRLTVDASELMVTLLRQILACQEKQVKLLEEISAHVGHNLRQRHAELTQWKEQHPEISQACRQAAETLAKVQAQYIQNITSDVYDSEDSLLESDYMLGEFVDKYGPRLAHLSGVLQMLAQLSSNPPAQPTEAAGS